MKNIKNIEIIFKLIKKETDKHKTPLVANPRWEKVNKTPFTTLVSCILSLRTKDKVTDEASIRLLSKYDSPQAIVKASDNDIQRLIYPVGFYRNKTKTLKQISQTLVKKYDGKVPDEFKDLIKLKGVGRKTANIVMVYGHKKSGYLPIDTHCHRIPNRLGWINTKTPEETEMQLKKIVPKKFWNDFNHLLVKFGQTVCLPISPLCSKCPIENYCKKYKVKRSR